MIASVLPELDEAPKTGLASAVARERRKCGHACSKLLTISHHLATYGQVRADGISISCALCLIFRGIPPSSRRPRGRTPSGESGDRMGIEKGCVFLRPR